MKGYANFQELQNKGIRFYVMYGQTGNSSYFLCAIQGSSEKIGSIGIPVPGGEMMIYNEEKEITEPGIVGELVYKGENVMMGYAESRGDLARGDVLNPYPENRGYCLPG